MSERDASTNGARPEPVLDVGELVEEVSESDTAGDGRSFERKVLTRVALLCITAVSLYLLAPSLLQVFSSWTQLKTLNPYWIVPALLFEAASYVSLWALQRVALRTRSWFAVATSQLSAGAAGAAVNASARASRARAGSRGGTRRRRRASMRSTG